jgi:hypothetical protein
MSNTLLSPPSCYVHLVHLVLSQLKHRAVAAAAARQVVHGQQQCGVDACTLRLRNTVKLNLQSV